MNYIQFLHRASGTKEEVGSHILAGLSYYIWILIFLDSKFLSIFSSFI